MTKPSITLSPVLPTKLCCLPLPKNPSFHQPVKYFTALTLSKFLLNAIAASVSIDKLFIPPNLCKSASVPSYFLSPLLNKDPRTNSNKAVLISKVVSSDFIPFLLSYSCIISKSKSVVPSGFSSINLFKIAP